MLNRTATGNSTRPPQPQRSFSSSSQQRVHRLNTPSNLSNVRSVSSVGHLVDLTADSLDSRNVDVWQQNRERGGLGGVLDAVGVNDDIDDMRPRKKVKLEIETPIARRSPEQQQQQGGSTVQHNAEDAHSKAPGQPLDLPPRNTSIAVHGSRKKDANDPVRKSEGIVPPSMATRLPPPKLVADFSPWTGLHPEDILNEQVIRTGYFDKPPGPSHNESNSARPSIWPNLSQKNNIALHTLSHLFTQVLDKRQGLAKCTAPSTFKPPPRVTVTDTKREAWLKDLANTNIPLRRQSRTIPHGIRGKLLMEQCLAKSIPLQRAVWLAKCVGANELRSFRRKGVSGSAAAQGETKWVRDWTAQVEQFVESIAGACGQDQWRIKIDYAIKLTSAFYTEGLLDRDQYLDWLVRTFAAASLDRLPLWTIIVQLYWRDLITIGRRGRKLAAAILEHLQLVSNKSNPAFEPLKTRLQKLITVLASTANSCLVLPKVWEKFKRLLSLEALQLSGQELQHTVAEVSKRNERLSAPMQRTAVTTRSPLLSLYTMLDGIGLGINMELLPAQCLELISEPYALVRAVLNWSSTCYRRGIARVYVAVQIISYLHDAGHDTDEAILEYLQQPDPSVKIDPSQLWATIGELVTRSCFATGAYLQWIIASGAVFSSEKSSLATGLLGSLPIEDLPYRLQNLRRSLLDRLGQAKDEELTTAKAKTEIEHALASSQMCFNDDNGTIASLSGSAKLVVGNWLRVKFVDPATNLRMTISTFGVMRAVLETLGNLPALSVLTDVASATDDAKLLASVADTLNVHAFGLAVLGSFEYVLDRLIERHRGLRSHSLDRAFLLAHIALLKRCPTRSRDLQLLNSDLAVHEQQHHMAVCSPASDNLVGMQAGALDSDAEIDAVFESGNSMDEQTMHRVFLRVIERAGKSDAPVATLESNVCRWLHQLRSVDSTGFEKLATEYVSATVLKSQFDTTATSGIAALVASRCLSFDAVAGVGSPAPPKTAVFVLHLLAAPLPSAGLSMTEAYAFSLQQIRFVDDHPDDVVSLVRRAADDVPFSFRSDWMLDLILRIITNHPNKLRKIFTESLPSQPVHPATAQMCKALLSQDQSGPAASDLDACEIIRSANALNAPISIGWLRLYTNTQISAIAGVEDAVKSALLQAVAEKSEVWPQLISAAKPENLREIHVWARNNILTELNAAQEGRAIEGEGAIEQLCQVLDVTYDAVKGQDDTQILTLLTERLKAQERLLSELEATESDHQDQLVSITRRLNILLHLCTLPGQSEASSDSARQARAQLVAALCNLLLHPRLQQQQQSLADYIHDVAVLHADALPEETLSTLARQIPQTDPSVRSLLGSSNASASSTTPNLALASRAVPTQTQQQRALARRQPPVQGTGGGGGGGGPARPPPNVERKLTPFPLRNWEIVSDSTPVMGENDCAVSLGLFGARRA
jgi:mediator of RNA polymerase II transcription subunit 12